MGRAICFVALFIISILTPDIELRKACFEEIQCYSKWYLKVLRNCMDTYFLQCFIVVSTAIAFFFASHGMWYWDTTKALAMAPVDRTSWLVIFWTIMMVMPIMLCALSIVPLIFYVADLRIPIETRRQWVVSGICICYLGLVYSTDYSIRSVFDFMVVTTGPFAILFGLGCKSTRTSTCIDPAQEEQPLA